MKSQSFTLSSITLTIISEFAYITEVLILL